MKKVLITGVSGFAGSFLSELLLDQSIYKVTGTYNTNTQASNNNNPNFNLVQIDLLNKNSVNGLIQEVRPDLVFHLAALASPNESFKNPELTLNVNISSQLNLFDAIKLAEISPRILIISTAEVYGNVEKNNLPIKEDQSLKPLSPYAVSKIAQEYLGLQYFYSSNLEVIIARSFNHIGPRQKDKYAIASFAKQIAQIEKNNLDAVLHVGNLQSRRDFTDVRDIVLAYDLLINKGQPGNIYNVGQGVSYKIEEVLNKLLSLSESKISIKQDNSRLNVHEIEDNVCDNMKLISQTGWRPKYQLDRTLKDTLDYFRDII